MPRHVNLIATNIRLPAGKEHLEAFLRKHPEDAPLRPALVAIFEGLVHANELGSFSRSRSPSKKSSTHSGSCSKLLAHPENNMRFGQSSRNPFRECSLSALQAMRHGSTTSSPDCAKHFGAEAEALDLATAFFGEAASRGLSLVDLLARRYDVVAANPPYMGSKNMGAVVKRYVTHHFPEGKRDLYAAFILRCRELATDGGRVAMVTQQAWMFLSSYSNLRAPNEEKRRTVLHTFGGILRNMAVEALAHLGRYAFPRSEMRSWRQFCSSFIGPNRRLNIACGLVV